VDLLTEAAAALRERFGPIDASSTATPWNASTYYDVEMGENLQRQFVSFERLVRPGKLAGIKQMTNEMETAWQVDSRRRVNIDPGYVATLKVVLATTKDAGHRVYLSRGIYAEVTLQFRHGSFTPVPHTYPDYAAANAVAFFNQVRARYL